MGTCASCAPVSRQGAHMCADDVVCQCTSWCQCAGVHQCVHWQLKLCASVWCQCTTACRLPGSVNMLCGSSKYILAERLEVKLKNFYVNGRGCIGESHKQLCNKSDENILSSILLLSQTVDCHPYVLTYPKKGELWRFLNAM